LLFKSIFFSSSLKIVNDFNKAFNSPCFLTVPSTLNVSVQTISSLIVISPNNSLLLFNVSLIVLSIILDNNFDVTICLETMAGKGTEIGRTIEEIKTIINGVKFKNKIGVCLDSCHLSDSGVDISKFDEYLDLFDKEIGLSYIKCIHINDSKNDLGSHKDRHENFGLGNLGFNNLINIIYNERLKDVPKILETPYVTKDDESKEKIYPPYKYEIEMIRNKTFDENLITKIRNQD
jgi:deoxyribonuclease-4